MPEWRLAAGLAAFCGLIAAGDVLAIAEIASGGDDAKRLKITLIAAGVVGASLGYFANWIRWAVRSSANAEEG